MTLSAILLGIGMVLVIEGLVFALALRVWTRLRGSWNSSRLRSAA